MDVWNMYLFFLGSLVFLVLVSLIYNIVKAVKGDHRRSHDDFAFYDKDGREILDLDRGMYRRKK